MLIIITYKKNTPQVCNSYNLQLINLDTTQKYSEHYKETESFRKKKIKVMLRR